MKDEQVLKMKEDYMIITKTYNTVTEGEFLDVLVQTILNQLDHDIEYKNQLQQEYNECCLQLTIFCDI